MYTILLAYLFNAYLSVITLFVRSRLGIMLCSTCNEDILEADIVNCSKCKAILHYSCAALRESAFRIMTKAAKKNWQCNTCKSKKLPKTQTPNNDVNKGRSVLQNSDDNTIKNLVESVNFMSDKFDDFSKN